MQFLVRKVATLGLIGSAMLSPLMLTAPQVMALPKQEVLKTLAPVLVYTVIAVDKDKKQAVPLTAEVKENGKTFNVAWVFFSAQDAQKFVTQQKTSAEQLKKKDAKAGEAQLAILNNTIVAPDSLATFYDAATSSDAKLKLQFVPMQQELDKAKQIESKFQGVPLFRVNFGQNRYGTAFFFSKQDLESELANLKKSQPKLVSEAKIEVVPLEGVISVLDKENGDDLKKVRLLAPLESRKLLQTIYEQNKGKAAPTTPSAKPTPKK